MGEPVDAERWTPLLPYALERATDRVFAFMNAHYLYALTRAGQRSAADAALRQLTADPPPDPAWEVGLALLAGVVDLADGRWAPGVASLEPFVELLPCVGGSDAQNDLFLQAYLVGLVRCGRAGDARRLLAQRIGDRAPNPQETAWFSSLT